MTLQRSSVPRRGRALAHITAAALLIGGCWWYGPPARTAEDGSSGTAATSTGSTGAGSSSTGSGATTAAAGFDGVALRLTSLALVDPHLFLPGDAGDSTGAPVDCVDLTPVLNSLVQADIDDGDFSLLLAFPGSAASGEVEVIEAECEDPGDGTPWSCVDAKSSQRIVIDSEQLATPPCVDLDLSLLQAVNLPDLHAPEPLCVRTARQKFSLSIIGAASILNLRDSRMITHLDDPQSPTALTDGVLYGFLPKVAAEQVVLTLPIDGDTPLWSMIDVPCAGVFPEQLPSLDQAMIDGTPTVGAWVAFNFVATRVLYTR